MVEQAERTAPPYVVIRFHQEPDVSRGHDHVAELETRDPDGGTTRWRVIEVIDAIRGGELFVVEGDGSGPDSVIEPAVCRACRRVTVRVETA
jgi:hypothetical protein